MSVLFSTSMAVMRLCLVVAIVAAFGKARGLASAVTSSESIFVRSDVNNNFEADVRQLAAWQIAADRQLMGGGGKMSGYGKMGGGGKMGGKKPMGMKSMGKKGMGMKSDRKKWEYQVPAQHHQPKSYPTRPMGSKKTPVVTPNGSISTYSPVSSPEGKKELTPDEEEEENCSKYCVDHPTCKAIAMTGDCCPNSKGEYLFCCDKFSKTLSPTMSEIAPPSVSPTTSSPDATPTTEEPTSSPSNAPTSSPSTLEPTVTPITLQPTLSPTTLEPTSTPTSSPTAGPTSIPTTAPTSMPSASPSAVPSAAPTTRENGLLGVLNANIGNIDPDGEAFQWLVGTDPLMATPSDVQEVINRYILAVLYFEGNGPNWNFCTADPLSSECPDGLGSGDRFLTAVSACNWFNVTCDSDGDVAIINLENNNVGGGPIPGELSALLDLRFLFLNDGFFTGEIPVELMDATSLRLLSLVSNSLAGPVPTEMAQLVNLEILLLDRNQLTGDLPDFMSALGNLRILSLGFNSFGGRIPASYAQLGQLDSFVINDNFVTGPIPDFLGDLPNLVTINLFNNAMTGPVPTSLGQLDGLTTLFLHGNNFSGSMPDEICALKRAGTLEVLLADCATGNIECDQPACCNVCF
jgi:hypothetical protein